MISVPSTYVESLPYKDEVVAVDTLPGAPLTQARRPPRIDENVSRLSSDYQQTALQIDETPFYEPAEPRAIPADVAMDVNSERLALLAQKYIGSRWSREEEARLQIDHAKVTRIFPRIDSAQMQQFDEERRRVEAQTDAALKLLDDLGIR